MKTILGLDLGTNSIGWAKVCVDDNGNYTREIKLGSRIIPMSQDTLSNFDKGVTGLLQLHELDSEVLEESESVHCKDANAYTECYT